MDLTECDRCGEEYPTEWPQCPFCAVYGAKRERWDDEDWN